MQLEIRRVWLLAGLYAFLGTWHDSTIWAQESKSSESGSAHKVKKKSRARIDPLYDIPLPEEAPNLAIIDIRKSYIYLASDGSKSRKEMLGRRIYFFHREGQGVIAEGSILVASKKKNVLQAIITRQAEGARTADLRKSIVVWAEDVPEVPAATISIIPTITTRPLIDLGISNTRFDNSVSDILIGTVAPPTFHKLGLELTGFLPSIKSLTWLNWFGLSFGYEQFLAGTLAFIDSQSQTRTAAELNGHESFVSLHIAPLLNWPILKGGRVVLTPYTQRIDELEGQGGDSAFPNTKMTTSGSSFRIGLELEVFNALMIVPTYYATFSRKFAAKSDTTEVKGAWESRGWSIGLEFSQPMAFFSWPTGLRIAVEGQRTFESAFWHPKTAEEISIRSSSWSFQAQISLLLLNSRDE